MGEKKIGEKVRNVFTVLYLANLLVTDDILNQLTDPDYCGAVFKLMGRGGKIYPLLLKGDTGDSQELRKYGTEQSRFYTENNFDAIINDERYFLCSQLEAHQEPFFVSWLKETFCLDFELLANLDPFQPVSIQVLKEKKVAFVLSQGTSPLRFTTSFTSIGPDGIFGRLTDIVTDDASVDIGANDLLGGYTVRFLGKRNVTFISVPPRFPDSIKQLQENLRTSLSESKISGNIWIPLMGIGDGGVTPPKSAEIILEELLQALKNGTITDANIFVDLPPDLNRLDYRDIFDFFTIGLDFEILKEEYRSNIKFQEDWDTNDLLGREVFAKQISERFNNILMDPSGIKHPFLVHLHGEWGSGKSTLLSYLKKYLKDENKDLIVVDFNAWRNQHLLPKWWGLLEQMRKDIFRQLPWYSRWPKKVKLWFSFLSLEAVVMWLLFILMSFALYFEPSKDVIPFPTKVLGIITAAAGLLYFFRETQNISFLKSSKITNELLENSAHPFEKVKSYFEQMIDISNRKIVVVIDDLDRCESKTIVGLIDGIQTLFKERRVLYVISSDKHWLQGAYNNVYSEYTSAMNRKGTCLGNLFLEKAFQLSFRVPKIRQEVKRRLIDHYLQENIIQYEETSNVKDKTPSIQRELPNSIHFINPYVDKVLQNTSKNIEKEKSHIIEKFYDYLDSNPRQIKRLLNTYEIYRLTIAFETGHSSFSTKQIDDLVHCVLIMLKWPLVYDLIERDPSKYLVSGGLSKAVSTVGEIENHDLAEKIFKKMDVASFKFFLGRE